MKMNSSVSCSGKGRAARAARDSGTTAPVTEDNNSEANSTTTSYSSVSTRDYSLPSSFAGDEGNRRSGEVCAEHKLSMTSLISSTNQSQTGQQREQQQQQQQQDMSRLKDDPKNEATTDRVGETTKVEHDGDEDDSDSKDQLTVLISKETEPMMHLVRLLKEMDGGKGNYHAGSTDFKERALVSLIHDFENEISMIEHRVKDKYSIMNGEQPQDPPPLPPNWVELEDPGSGDVYYANEATGECMLMFALRYYFGSIESVLFTIEASYCFFIPCRPNTVGATSRRK